MLRQQIHQSKVAIAELVAKLQEEQAKLDRLEARVEKYEEAIAFLQEAIAEDPLLWDEVRDRLEPAWLQDAEDLKDRILRALYGYSRHISARELGQFLQREERDILPWLERMEPDFISASETGYQINIGGVRYVEALEASLSAAADQIPTSEQIFDAECLPMQQSRDDDFAASTTVIWDGNGSARLGCAKQKLAKEWKDLLTLWGCTAEVTKAESFSDKEIKWEVAILGITRSQLETLAKAHTSPHAEVPSPGRKVERDRVQPSSEQIFDAECLPVDAISTDGDLPSLILGHLESVGSSDFVDLCQAAGLEFCDDDEIANTLESLKEKGLIFEISEEPWLWSFDAPAAAVESTELISGAPPQPEIAIAVKVDQVLDGASPLNLSAAQISDLEDALVGAPPSIDDIAEEKPSAYAEEMALRLKPGAKIRSLPFPADPKHKSSRKRTGVVRRIDRDGANIYAFVAELTEAGKDSRHTAFYNLEAVEVLEEAPAIELAIGAAEKKDFDYFEPFDPLDVAFLRGIEVEVFQFLTEKAAQADLYVGNDPTASFSEIGDAIKLESVDWDRLRTALDNLEARGSILHRDIYGVGDRWQIATEKPSQDHFFKVGDRVTICGDSKGEDLVGKVGTLTAVSLNGCVLYLDGEDEKDRLFFCKEDLSPCFTFSQTA